MTENQPADPDHPDATAVADPAAEQAEQPKPFFVVESGNPTAEEIAALTVVLAAAASGDEQPAPAPVSGWASPSRMMRSIGTAGFGGWRAEYQPR
ncbi:acyl-CoA carboxylase subunit epsilon [Blastococcus sp. Marseille-P5729]|uniref:acyl-CoA carboxylase subunit epsilon n=1 Tax=Blastococcus sp. Marseille-P5729 TaxID=2086582 RepID=UPI000D0FD31A|nr:acyl-CoA carboxylase subunit epsilon [Blastococcus sp. Marseille-P5729]